MILHMFSLFDTKANFFNTPFFFPHIGQAIRAASDLAADSSTIIGRHPEDYCLFKLGGFNDQSGEFMAQLPENLGNCSTFLKPQPPLPLVQHGVKED